MATPSEIITMINNDLPTNGSNDITAAVLRPVLTAMVNQINDLVGDASGLPIGSTTVIEAINNTAPASLTVHTGTADPNDTPPSSFEVGDFYTQTISGVIFAFWQYNGVLWIQHVSLQQQKLRNYTSITGSYTIVSTDDIIVYNGSNISDVITLPSVTPSFRRVLVLVNISAFNITTNINYTNLSGSTTNSIDAGRSVKLISNGTKYQQINTVDTI